MISRIGKIACLPGNIRHEINQRLYNGEGGPYLLAWLNSLPEVQAVLARKFAGRPINQQNLSNWRTGGYSEWRFRQEILTTSLEVTSRLAATRAKAEIKLEQGNSSHLNSGGLKNVCNDLWPKNKPPETESPAVVVSPLT